MNRTLPNIRGFVDLKVENELNIFFNHLYDIIEDLAKQTNVSLETKREGSPSATSTTSTMTARQETSAGLVRGVFAQPLLGEGSDPNLKTGIPDDVTHSNLEIVPGAVAVGGYTEISNGFGTTIQVLTK